MLAKRRVYVTTAEGIILAKLEWYRLGGDAAVRWSRCRRHHTISISLTFFKGIDVFWDTCSGVMLPL
jgi:hypothetical protein